MFHKEKDAISEFVEFDGGSGLGDDMPPAPQSEWLTAKEAAAYLKVRTRSLLRWVRLGNLRAYTLSGTKRHVWRFRKEDLDAALLSKAVVTCNSLPVRSEKGAKN